MIIMGCGYYFQVRLCIGKVANYNDTICYV